MDQALAQIYPINRIGNDGFNWWVGQVEGTAADEPNNKGGTRYKVRIVGEHPQSFELLPTKDLPWANVMMPVTVPFMPGNEGGANSQLKPGCWVVGFYLDPERQKPIIMGSIGQTPGATTIVKNARPDDLPFTTAIPATVNPATDGQPAPENPQGGQSEETNKSTGGMPDGTVDKDGNPRVPISTKKESGVSRENWCQTVAEKCSKEDIKTKATSILTELFNELKNNGGNIGSYLVNKSTGAVYSTVNIVRRYINKFLRVINHFIAKVKGFIIDKLKAAVNDLIKALIYPSEEGNVLTPVTQWFNNLLKDLGCRMADLGDRLAEWLTNVLMDLVNQIYRAAVCQIDTLVNGILSKMNSLMNELLDAILGPLQEILQAIAGPLDIIGGAISFVLNLLGISCSGPDQTCARYKSVCVDGSKKEGENDQDFLDNLLSSIDNLVPATGADYTQYTCAEAYSGGPLGLTTIGFTGGVPIFGGTGSTTQAPKINYTIDDIDVEEGDDAAFTVTRSGYTEGASSVTYKTLTKGTATPNTDYYSDQGILGFAPNETQKKITIKTFYNVQSEGDEDFFVSLSLNTPTPSGGIKSNFSKNIGRCRIVERNILEPGNPYTPKDVNPTGALPDVFPTDEVDVSSDGPGTKDPSQSNSELTPTYRVTSDRSTVKEGEFVIYTITTTNVRNGTIGYYTLSGDGISSKDIIGGKLTGSFVVNNNLAYVTVGIEEDNTPEDEETLTFTINGTGAAVSVLILPNDGDGANLDDFDTSIGDSLETVFTQFTEPTVNPNKIITDDNGGIIDIPIDNSGSPWAEPPYVFIGGEGFGATATALLDQNGFLTEIRVKSSGYGYRKNLAEDNGVRCIIDTFTVIRPGIGYTKTPDLYVNGELGVAEAVIDDNGFVIGARILDRRRTFSEFPEIVVVGGGGYGAKLLPSLACLDTEALSTIGSTKIGTGRYVDCP
jgi:hypothetical protein